jgi:hypothetical protein
MRKLVTFLLLTVLFYACANTPSNILQSQYLYYGGDIITMKGDTHNYVEALVTNSDTIVYTGPLYC